MVTNQGPNAATDVVVQDPTPAGLTFIANGGDCTTAFPCALGTMLPGQAKTITARYTVGAGVTAVMQHRVTVVLDAGSGAGEQQRRRRRTPRRRR